MTWLYHGEPVDKIDPKFAAFVYIITNTVTGRQYIGLKTAVTPKTRSVKGKKKRIKVESDWRDYWSSSDELKADIENLGQDKFRREILYFCELKAHANYLEAREQIDRRVLENPDKYYNGIVNCRVSRNHIKNLKL